MQRLKEKILFSAGDIVNFLSCATIPPLANPALMSINCSKPEEVALVNSLCWVEDYSDRYTGDTR